MKKFIVPLLLAAFALAILPQARATSTEPLQSASSRASAPTPSEPVIDQAPAAQSGWLVLWINLLATTPLLLGSLRNIQDAGLAKTKALPAAAASASTDWLDIGTGPHTDKLELRFGLAGDVPALADAHAITLTLEHSDDGVNNSGAIGELKALTITGGGGVGAVAASNEVRLPTSAKRFVRATASVAAAGGDNTGVNFSLIVLQ